MSAESEPTRAPDAAPGASGPLGSRAAESFGGFWFGPLSVFNPGRVPAMARPNYRRELTAACLIPFMVVLFEGSVLSVLVRIGYERTVPGGLLNTITAFVAITPALANLSSFVWVRLAHGSHKIRAMVRLMGAMVAFVLVIGLAPRNLTGLLLTAGAALAARVCWSGMLTLRSTIWRQNYPDGSRARITGRFAMVHTMIIAVLGLGLGQLMDWANRAGAEATTLRILAPIGCSLGLLGLLMWRTVRVREHRSLLRSERDTEARNAPSFNPALLARVLRQDRDFDRYMTGQMLLGTGNILCQSLVAIVVRERLGADYLGSLLVSSVIALAIMPVAVPLWSRLLDARHAAAFRAVHSWVFVVALVLLVLAVHRESYPLMLVYAAVQGIAFGGGAIGWTLAHLDFAPREQTSRYMGVHVTLTGMRGLICWLSGVALYEGLESIRPHAGDWVFVLGLALAVGGSLVFVWLSRDLKRRGVINEDGSRKG